jgi:hypothetical protein
MTSTLNSASTDRMLRRFATRRPEWFSVLTCLAYGLPVTVLVLLSSVLYGVTNIGNLALDRDPVPVGVQTLAAVGIGVAFAAVVVVTGTIWPLVVIDAASFFANTVPYGNNPAPTDSGTLVGSLIVGALAAACGIWLLHRDQHRHAAHSGEGDHASTSQKPPAAQGV